jgi:hypothetical protein
MAASLPAVARASPHRAQNMKSRAASAMAERFTKHGAKILSFFCLSGIHAGFFSI